MTYQHIFITELGGRRRGGARLVDGRERGEYEAGHVPGAVNLPLSELAGREDGTRPNTVLIRAGGHRSSQAAASLARLGKTGLLNRSGGTAAWVQGSRELHRGGRP
ncbi:rhodanese-related sulfurtransferase [Deinococcus budaensis]|uniref:Rhodanese-related sulfurtransferase n=1 Tax=Deinococcus budaensis TaxID=1665626 RepID=A0A7W8LQL4_9DEIO|nr:rhodanese-like domain-containing protein [Deinococcus budaensis]MBB5234712.1 rhodanese-related sulfurtransferase [Deinococcus budaensis]